MEKEDGQAKLEQERPNTWYVVDVAADGNLREVYGLATDNSKALLEKIRYLSEDPDCTTIGVQSPDHETILAASRDAQGNWQLEAVSSDLIKQFQTVVRKTQWSQKWLFSTDRPRKITDT